MSKWYTKEDVHKAMSDIGINEYNTNKFIGSLKEDIKYTLIELHSSWINMYPEYWFKSIKDELEKIPMKEAQEISDEHYNKYFVDSVEI